MNDGVEGDAHRRTFGPCAFPFDPTAGTARFRPIEPRHSEQLLTQLHCSAFLWVGLRERHKCTKSI